MRQQPAVRHSIKDQRVDRRASQRRGVVQVADDFAPEHPEVVRVFAKRLGGASEVDEVMEERPEALDKLSAGK